MTTAKLVTAPSEGHGLTQKITDPTYSALANGKPARPLIAIVELKPVGLGQRETARGRHQHVVYEATHLEPVIDIHQANELRYHLQALYEARTATGSQRPLPLALGRDDEKRLALMERMETWASEHELTAAELEDRWRENFGAGTDDDWSFGDQGVPGDYRKASLAHLTSFCYSTGVLSMDEPLSHQERTDVDDGDEDDGPADEGAADDAAEATA